MGDLDLPIFSPRMGKRTRRDVQGRSGSFFQELYARISRNGGFRRRSSARPAQAAVQHPSGRRVVVKARYMRMTPGAAKAAKLHLRYIERDGVEKDGSKGVLYGPDGPVERRTFEEPRLHEKHQFRFIVSPEDAGELDLTGYVQRLMKRVQIDVGREIEWAAVTVRNVVTKAIGARQPASLSSRLARVRWGAVLSFTPDLTLEDHIRSEQNKNAFRLPGFVIDGPNVAIPPRAVPLLKIFGTVGRETLVVSKYEYAKAKPRWRTGLRAFLDLIKDAPVLCLGMTELPWALADILGELGSSSTFISRFVVLEDDALVQSGEIDRMLDPRTELVTSRGAAGDLVQAAEAGLVLPNAIVPQPLTTEAHEPLKAYGDIALVVTPSTAVKKEERQQLFEMLFAPTSVYWAPFVHNLDLERTLTKEIVEELDGHLSKDFPGSVAVVEGAAATGKTVLLKRVALDLASKGHLVLWLRPYFYPDASARIDQLFKALAKVAKRGVCLIQDDPYALGSLNPKELGAVARSNSVPAKFLFGMRSSDWSTRQPADLLGPLKLFHTFHLPDSLDEGEWARLEPYLQTLGVARTPAEARQQLAGPATRSARDTLSMLYGLMPETRAHIQQSITQEYFRLGDQAGFQRVVLGQAQHSSDLLKRAYEKGRSAR